MLLQQEATLQETVAQSQERERLLLDQQQQASCFSLSPVNVCFAFCAICTNSSTMSASLMLSMLSMQTFSTPSNQQIVDECFGD